MEPTPRQRLWMEPNDSMSPFWNSRPACRGERGYSAAVSCQHNGVNLLSIHRRWLQRSAGSTHVMHVYGPCGHRVHGNVRVRTCSVECSAHTGARAACTLGCDHGGCRTSDTASGTWARLLCIEASHTGNVRSCGLVALEWNAAGWRCGRRRLRRCPSVAHHRSGSYLTQAPFA